MSAYQDLLDVLDYAPGDRPYNLLQEVLRSGFGGSSDCIVASKIPGIHLDSDLDTGGGTDDTELLQAALDTPTIKELVIDGVALVTGLKVYSNTKITFLPGCGLYLADDSDCPVIYSGNYCDEDGKCWWSNCLNAPREDGTYDGTAYTAPPEPDVCENVEIIGGTLNGNDSNQTKTDWADHGWDQSNLCCGIAILNGRNITVRGVTTKKCAFWNFMYNGIDNLVFEDCTADCTENEVDGNSDGVDILGPARRVVIRNFSYPHVSDDPVVFCPVLFPWKEAGMDAGGDIRDVLVDGVRIKHGLTSANIGFYRDARRVMENIVIRNLSWDYRALIGGEFSDAILALYSGLAPKNTRFETREWVLTTPQEWAADMTFVAGDLIKDTETSKGHICRRAHRSQVTLPSELTQGYWLDLTWLALHVYRTGQIVYDAVGDKWYRCATAGDAEVSGITDGTFATDISEHPTWWTEITFPYTVLETGLSDYEDVIAAMNVGASLKGDNATYWRGASWLTWDWILNNRVAWDQPLKFPNQGSLDITAISDHGGVDYAQGVRPIKDGVYLAGVRNKAGWELRNLLSFPNTGMPDGADPRTIVFDVAPYLGGSIFQYGQVVAQKWVNFQCAIGSGGNVALWSYTPGAADITVSKAITANNWYRVLARYASDVGWQMWVWDLVNPPAWSATPDGATAAITLATNLASSSNHEDLVVIGGNPQGGGIQGGIKNVGVWDFAFSDAQTEAYLEGATVPSGTGVNEPLIWLPLNDYESKLE